MFIKVIKNLFWADYHGAMDTKEIRRKQINYIFNISDEVPFYTDINSDIVKYRLPISFYGTDNDKKLMKKSINKILVLINELLENNNKVLIYSKFSQQRSAYILEEYFKKYDYKKYNDNFLYYLNPSVFNYGNEKIY